MIDQYTIAGWSTHLSHYWSPRHIVPILVTAFYPKIGYLKIGHFSPTLAAPVNLTPNLPKTLVQTNNTNKGPKNIFYNLRRLSDIPKQKTSTQEKFHKPLKDIISVEVTCYKSFLDDQKQQINDQIEQPEGFDVSRWWADHHKRFEIWHLL